MDIIQLLPDSVANQIAAGEVIQRPESVIKELVENAVDAGAKTINVLVENAGRTSIQVIDDGCGMSITDARLAFERHATSKIRKASDLFALTTMGFRGEALPSIVAVAQVRLTTRRKEDELGTVLTIHGSKFISQEPISCPVGSNFLVENLFYNVPARRHFLKSDNIELARIIEALQRIMLVYPEIAFTFSSNGHEMYNLKATTLHQRILDIFSKKVNQQLLPVDVDTTLCRITGFVGKPEAAQKKGKMQYFFVNGRFMKHAYFQSAINNAFVRMVPEGKQVPFFIYFTVEPKDIDVNIHPTKTEIKFLNDKSICDILGAAVKNAVGRHSNIPSIDFDTEGKPDIPVFSDDNLFGTHTPDTGIDPTYNPFKPQHAPRPISPVGGLGTKRSKISGEDWNSLYEELTQQQEPQQQSLFDDSFDTGGKQEVADEQMVATRRPQDCSPSHYQYKGKYIMTAVKDGLMIIDQYRAHLCVLYDKYLRQRDNKKPAMQTMLFSEPLHFSMTELLALPQVLPQLQQLGFELVDMGQGSYSINAVPAGLEGVDVTRLISELVAKAADMQGISSEEVFASMALSVARAGAIPYGQALSNDEMDTLINDLFSCPLNEYTPDGKKVIGILPQNEIENFLG